MEVKSWKWPNKYRSRLSTLVSCTSNTFIYFFLSNSLWTYLSLENNHQNKAYERNSQSLKTSFLFQSLEKYTWNSLQNATLNIPSAKTSTFISGLLFLFKAINIERSSIFSIPPKPKELANAIKNCLSNKVLNINNPTVVAAAGNVCSVECTCSRTSGFWRVTSTAILIKMRF